MKKLIIFLSMLYCSFSFSQTGILIEMPQMLSSDEWAYATRGYLDDVKMGKDPAKKGLDFNQVIEFNYGSSTVEVIAVVGKECSCTKAYIIIVDRVASYCIIALEDYIMKGSQLSKQVVQPWHREIVMEAEMRIIQRLIKLK